MTRRPLATALALALLAAATGCSLGGDDGDEARTTETLAQPAQAPTSNCADVAGSEEGTAILAPTVVVVREWRIDDENLFPALGCVVSDGEPVEGVRVRVNNYLVPEATDENGGFHFPIDVTLPQRAIARVADASGARVGGDDATDEQLAALRQAEGSLIVRFRMSELAAEREPNGGIRVRGRASYDDGTPPPVVVLYAYELSGRVVDAQGQPLGGAIVATSSLDLELWSFSPPAAPSGRYRSSFLPSGEEQDRVGFLLRVAVGDDVWELSPNQVVFFEKLKSAQLDIQVPPPGFPLVVDEPRAVRGAVFEGIVIGVTIDGEPVTPTSAKWLDDDGRFELVLPASAAGETVRFWQSRLYAFSRTEARPGGPVDIAYWPKALPRNAPRELDELRLPE